MSSQVSLWSSLDRWSSPILRWRPAVLTVLALAAGYTIYYHRDSIPFTETPPDRATDLRRSNAIRLRRTQADLDRSNAIRLRRARHEESFAEQPDLSTDLDFLEDHDASQAILGYHSMHTPDGSRVVQFALNRDVVNVYDGHPDFAGESRGRYSIQRVFLRLFLFKHLPIYRMVMNPSPMFSQALVDRLRDLGFDESIAADVVATAESGTLRPNIRDWLASQELLRGPGGIIIADPDMLRDMRAFQAQTTEGQTVADTDSDHSVHEEEAHHDEAKTRVLNLLFRIAEEQSRREGYVHRGITCNGCGTSPLKGIRYRCSNCNDFDLCENCESHQFHQKNHIFFKVRIPSPYVRNQSLDVMYPAKNPASHHHLSKQQIKMFSETTGYRENEIEGFWEQFKCMAATEWPADPLQLCVAIDHRNLEQLFIHTNSGRPPPPNLVYDRVFHFYDTDDNNLIGFEEFVEGLANLNKKGPKQKWARIFKCYDLDGDGYVDRKDFIRMLKAHYALTQEMTAEIVAHMEEDFSEEETRELISGGRPLAAAFTEGSVGEGQTPPEMGEGKRLDGYGDPVIIDNEAIVKDHDHFQVETSETIANFAEENAFGDVKQQEKDIQELVSQVYNEQLPRLLEIYQSYFSAEPDSVYFARIDWTRQEKNEEVAAKVHNLMAKDWRDRHFVRCSAVKDRERRKEFFPANGVSNHPKMASESRDKTKSNDALRAYMVQRALQAVSQDEESSNAFQRKALHLCESLALPEQHLGALVKYMVTVSDLEWSEDEIVEGLRGHSLDTARVRKFVVSWFKLLEENAPPPPSPPEENAIKVSATPSRRSRSSSKVRFEDAFTSNEDEPDTRSVTSISSRSIPFNERWGGLELPEPEEDFGREVLYEVVQESMNDIIDSIFKVREDLWIEAQMTKPRRQRHWQMMLDVAYEDDMRPTMLLDYLHIFLRQARIAHNYPSASDPLLSCSGADSFEQFLSSRISESENFLTGSKCSSCEDGWVFFGGWCKCGTGSAQKKLSILNKSKSVRTEKCQTCAQKGQNRIKRQDDSCEWCGTMSVEREQEDRWVRGVLSKLKHPEESSANALDASAAQEGVEGPSKGDASTRVASPDPASPRARSASPSQSSLYAGDPSKPTEISQTLLDASFVDNQRTDVTAQTAQNDAGSMAQDYPEMAHELHNAVRSFNEAALSVEDSTTMQKSLEKLLEESGYTKVELLHKSDSQAALTGPPSPLAQSHPPRSSSLCNGTVEEEEEEGEDEEEDKPDPTLPQHRQEEVWIGGAYEAILEEEARRLDPTGSLWHSKQKGKKGKRKKNEFKEPKPPSEDDLLFWAALTILEAEDEKRGGPGRLSQSEFLEIMLNERGRKLEFLGDWMNMTVF